jgi:hypothetical protein
MSSWEALAWAKKQEAGNPAKKLILLLLAEKCDEDFTCFPSISKLSMEAELTKRPTQTAIQALKDAGLLCIQARGRENGSQTSNRYHLHVDLQASPCEKLQKPTSVGGAVSSTPPVLSAAPPPVLSAAPPELPITNSQKNSLSRLDLSSHDARGSADAERETDAPENETPLVPSPRVESDGNALAQEILDAYSTALGRPVVNGTQPKLLHQAAVLLKAGYPVGWLVDRARELAAKGWTNLEKHVEHSTVPLPSSTKASRKGLPPWCGHCGDNNPAAEFNPRFRTTNGLSDGPKCPNCNPALVTEMASGRP